MNFACLGVHPRAGIFAFIELFCLLYICNRWFQGYSLVYNVIVGLINTMLKLTPSTVSWRTNKWAIFYSFLDK